MRRQRPLAGAAVDRPPLPAEIKTRVGVSLHAGTNRRAGLAALVRMGPGGGAMGPGQGPMGSKAGPMEGGPRRDRGDSGSPNFGRFERMR